MSHAHAPAGEPASARLNLTAVGHRLALRSPLWGLLRLGEPGGLPSSPGAPVSGACRSVERRTSSILLAWVRLRTKNCDS